MQRRQDRSAQGPILTSKGGSMEYLKHYKGWTVQWTGWIPTPSANGNLLFAQWFAHGRDGETLLTVIAPDPDPQQDYRQYASIGGSSFTIPSQDGFLERVVRSGIVRKTHGLEGFDRFSLADEHKIASYQHMLEVIDDYEANHAETLTDEFRETLRAKRTASWEKLTASA
jgi:hypothetical protein